jgi:hypothetical protein
MWHFVSALCAVFVSDIRYKCDWKETSWAAQIGSDADKDHLPNLSYNPSPKFCWNPSNVVGDKYANEEAHHSHYALILHFLQTNNKNV